MPICVNDNKKTAEMTGDIETINQVLIMHYKTLSISLDSNITICSWAQPVARFLMMHATW